MDVAIRNIESQRYKIKYLYTMLGSFLLSNKSSTHHISLDTKQFMKDSPITSLQEIFDTAFLLTYFQRAKTETSKPMFWNKIIN